MNVHPLGPFGAYSSFGIEIAVLVAVALVFIAIPRARIAGLLDGLALIVDRHPRRVLAAVLFGSLVSTLFCAVFVLRCFPNSADEYGYLFLAQTLGAGRWWNELHPLHEFFSFIHIAEKDGRWISRFLPGWPIVLAAAGKVGLDGCWINPLLGVCSLAVFHRLARRVTDNRVAILSTLVLAGSGYFVFMSASLRSHTFTSLLLLSFVLALVHAATRNSVAYGLLAGGCLGLALLTRPYTAVLIAICILPWYVVTRKTRRTMGWVHVILGALPFIVFLIYYNLQTTGHALQLVTTWMDPGEGLGFVKGHTPLIGVEHAARRLASFLEWSSPALLPVFVVALASRRARRPGTILPNLAWTFPLLVVGHMFYFAFGGTQYGPRFYYEAFPFVVLVAVDYAFGEQRDAASRRVGFARAGLLAGCVFAAVSLPFMALRQHAVVLERQDVFAVVDAADLHGAVVLVAISTGKLWPMGVGDLIRNGIAIDGDVIFARDLGRKTSRLFEAFPDREFYRYVRDRDEAGGRLVAVRGRQSSLQE